MIGDGGYITEMERRGYATAGPWTPEVNVEHPDAGRMSEAVQCICNQEY